MKDMLRIATRESRLALWQAEHVAGLLCRAHPGLTVELVPMTTKGDQILDTTLAKIGGKGLFIKELEVAMYEGRADLAVHSMKDVPADLPEGMALASVLERADPHDAFVSNRYPGIAALPQGARVGTSSLRRELMLRAAFPKLDIRPVRGNVGTRLRKLDAGEFDALLMAAAGLKRLGLADRIRQILPTRQFLPAPGQGALGIEVLAANGDAAALVAPLEDAATRAATAAERAVSRLLGGSCEVPLAAFAEVEPDGRLRLRARVGNHRTGELVAAEALGAVGDPEPLGAEVVEQLKKLGALQLLPVPG